MRNLIFLSSLIIFLCCCNENSSNFYSTYRDLVDSNDLKKGWIPSIIDEESKYIYETHNIDNNKTFVRFHYSNSAWLDSIRPQYHPVSIDTIINVIRMSKNPAKPEWFINETDLRKNQPIALKVVDFYLICDTITRRGFIFKDRE